MPIDVSCPKCGSGLPVPEEFAGRTVRCGGCQELIPVPGLAPPALPGAEGPPPLPGAEQPPPLPQSRPVAKPVARAVAVRATPVPAEPAPPEIRFEPADSPSRRRDRDDESDRAMPQTKTALFVIGALLLFGCCGVGVLGFAFTKIANNVAEVNRKDRFITATPPAPKTVPEQGPVFTPDVPRPSPRPVTPPTAPKTRPTPKTTPTRPDPKAPATDLPVAPSPQGMKGLKIYVSFNADPIREDTTRSVLPVAVPPQLRDGPTRKAARFQVPPDRDGGPPKFACDLSASAESLAFREDDPFTIALWVRGGGQNAVAFAAVQGYDERAPRLVVKTEARSLRVDFHADKADAEKKFTRSATRTVGDMINAFHHVAITRSPDRTLAVFVDGAELTDAPAESLPAKLPAELTFRYAGFGLRPPRLGYSFDVDEFCVFDRALTKDELKTLAGKGGK